MSRASQDNGTRDFSPYKSCTQTARHMLGSLLNRVTVACYGQWRDRRSAEQSPNALGLLQPEWTTDLVRAFDFENWRVPSRFDRNWSNHLQCWFVGLISLRCIGSISSDWVRGNGQVWLFLFFKGEELWRDMLRLQGWYYFIKSKFPYSNPCNFYRIIFHF